MSNINILSSERFPPRQAGGAAEANDACLVSRGTVAASGSPSKITQPAASADALINPNRAPHHISQRASRSSNKRKSAYSQQRTRKKSKILKFFVLAAEYLGVWLFSLCEWVGSLPFWCVHYLALSPFRHLVDWIYDFPTRVHARRTTQRYLAVMESTESYQTYRATAASLDLHCGVSQWRSEAPPAHVCNAAGLLFDAHVARALVNAGNEAAMAVFLRSMLTRGAHGITNPALYEYFLTAKNCIEDYNTAMSNLIEAFSGSRAPEDLVWTARPTWVTVKGARMNLTANLPRLRSRPLARGATSDNAEREQSTRTDDDLLLAGLLSPVAALRERCAASMTHFPLPKQGNVLTNNRRASAPDTLKSGEPLQRERHDTNCAVAPPPPSAAVFDEHEDPRPYPPSTFLTELTKQAYSLTGKAYRCDLKRRIHILTDTLRSVGRTALVLSGGASMGAYHGGVIRALFEADLLPDIISGSSAGSIIAALICTKSSQELKTVIDNVVLSADTLQLTPFGQETNIWLKLKYFMQTGSLLPVQALMECLRTHCGDMTFMEAYKLSGKVLNISVTRDQHSGTWVDRHVLLNYLTAPNVVIWSAVTASSAMPGLFTAVQLIERDPHKGVFQPFLPGELWCDGSVVQDIPRNRLSELFHVNFVIVSQVNPFVVPFLEPPKSYSVINPRRSLLGRWWFAATRELGRWLRNLFDAGLLPARGFLELGPPMLSQRYTGDITILPVGSLLSAFPDYLNLVNNPSGDYVGYVATKAQSKTWPLYAHIANITHIERVLLKELKKLKT